MPRAEAGTTKDIANRMKSKGLQRLRWYCQACSRQMRDENGFKCHVASESHVRNMMLIGEDPRKAINDFSAQFLRDFLQLLRTGHGEKKINVNHFYQEYIANKSHVHMNATKWASLTELAKYLGREGICRVEESEGDENGRGAGLTISWIDNSPEALRRQDALRKKERQDKGDEEREQKAIQQQILRARKDVVEDQVDDEADELEDEESEVKEFRRKDGERIKLDFSTKKVVEKPPSPPLTVKDDSGSEEKSDPMTEATINTSQSSQPPSPASQQPSTQPPSGPAISDTAVPTSSKASLKSISLSSSKPKNVFATASKKNALGGTKRAALAAPQKPMSKAEMIMKEEIERKRLREANGGSGFKRQRIS